MEFQDYRLVGRVKGNFNNEAKYKNGGFKNGP